MTEGEKASFSKKAFGSNFKWGVSTAAYQIEGACDVDGKGASIWDKFCATNGKISKGESGSIACDFYNRLNDDIDLMHQLKIPNFRFSLSWSRIFPQGTGQVNQQGVDFYHRLIDKCLSLGIDPWITLYHWDLPYALELKGGWRNREIVTWFTEFVTFCIKTYGQKVKYWMVLNEPIVFTGAGHFLGIHAPGRTGFKNFLPAVHHAALCQAEGGRIIKSLKPDAEVGTTFSCSYIEPFRDLTRDHLAAKRVDAVLNRLFIEPLLGLGYPISDVPFLSKINKYMQPGDAEKLKFDFDFIGIQNYTREIVKHAVFTPFIWANIVKATKRKVPVTLMDWEVYPPSLYKMLKQFSGYKGIKKLLVTENGAAFEDYIEGGKIKDKERQAYLQSHIAEVLKAKEEGVNVQGYFVWTFTDNFEWAEGYRPRFGLVHVDFDTQKRTVKSSGYWFRQFLSNEAMNNEQ